MTKALRAAISYPTEKTTLFMYQAQLNLEYTGQWNLLHIYYDKFNYLKSEDCEKSA